MSNSLKKLSWALAFGLVLIHVFPVAADLLVCVDARPDRGCCEESSAPDPRTDTAARLLDGADCGCCVPLQIVSNTAEAPIKKVSVGRSVETGVVQDVAPITRCIASTGHAEPGNAGIPSLRTVVLLI